MARAGRPAPSSGAALHLLSATRWRNAWRGDRALLAAAVAGVAVMAALTRATDLVLVSSLGVLVVVVGLVAHPRSVVALGGVTVAVAVALVAATPDPDAGAYRVVNVVLGVVIGVAAATSRTLRLREVSRLRRRDAALLASIGDGVIGTDAQGRVLLANPAAAALLETVEQRMLGRSLHELATHLRPDASACPGGCALVADPAAVAAGGTAPGNPGGEVVGEAFVLPSGHRIDVDYTVRPVLGEPGNHGDAGGGTGPGDGVVIGLRDAAPRLAAVRQVEQLTALRLADTEQRRVLHQLERALRPPLPRLYRVGLDVTYLPADEASPTGGDLYDVSVRPDGTLYLLVVDVVGKGVASTRDALRLVHTARPLVTSGTPLVDLTAALDAHFAAEHSSVVATLVACTYDPGSGHLEVACGGHPPPLLVRADGRTEWLESAGRPVGYPLAGTDAVATADLDAGDTLLLYTDGLVEAQRDIVMGLDTLAANARRVRDRPIDGWTERLVAQALEGASGRDDTLALALRRTVGAPSLPPPRVLPRAPRFRTSPGPPE